MALCLLVLGENVMVRKAVVRFPLETGSWRWQQLGGNLNPRKDCFVEGKDPESAQDCISAGERVTEVSLSRQDRYKPGNETKEIREMDSLGEHAFSRIWSLWIEFILKIHVSRSEKDQLSFVSLVHFSFAGLCGQAPFSPRPMRGNRAGSRHSGREGEGGWKACL